MDLYTVPIGFGLALSANISAMNRYAQLSESQKQDILTILQKSGSLLGNDPFFLHILVGSFVEACHTVYGSRQHNATVGALNKAIILHIGQISANAGR